MNTAGYAYALDAFEMLKDGDTLLQRGDLHGAVSAYSNAIAADPRSKVAYTKRASASTGLGHLSAAVRDYSSALDIEPTAVSARLLRAQLYLRMCKFDDAEQDFGVILEAKPDHDGAKQGKEKVTTGRGHLQTAQVWNTITCACSAEQQRQCGPGAPIQLNCGGTSPITCTMWRQGLH
jgi:tetratricopeptide (TPR) repeat protein